MSKKTNFDVVSGEEFLRKHKIINNEKLINVDLKGPKAIVIIGAYAKNDTQIYNPEKIKKLIGKFIFIQVENDYQSDNLIMGYVFHVDKLMIGMECITDKNKPTEKKKIYVCYQDPTCIISKIKNKRKIKIKKSRL